MNIIEIYKKFPKEIDCLNHLENVRWNNKPICPYCGATKSSPIAKENRHHCNKCNTSYSVTVKTIFHNTKIDLQKWFLAISLILNAKKGISSRQLSRDLQVNKNTAWFMGMRIRKAMVDDGKLLEGIVEMDETYVGGKPRKGDGKKRKRGRGTDKTPVIGIIQRNGSVKANVSQVLTSKKLETLIRRHVNTKTSTLMTDEYRSYSGMSKILPHKVVNHQFCYVNGDIHTNSIEGFWALLKRGIVGQYHKVSRTHLQKYVNEFAYRYNNRKTALVFENTLIKAVGGIK